MKFKMNERSLFAMLLRSPWWWSLLLAIAVAAGARMVAPEKYSIPAMLGSLPFVVIAGMSFWRQRNMPSEAEAAALNERISSMSWKEFSAMAEAAFEKDGYEVKRTKSGKPGADIVLEKHGGTIFVGARRWKAATHGEDSIRELQSAIDAAKADQGIYLALAPMSENAWKAAQIAGIKVVQGAALVAMLRPYLAASAMLSPMAARKR